MFLNQCFYSLKNQRTSPTSLQLAKQLRQQGWKEIFLRRWADFSEENLLFNQDAAQALEYKHLFANLCKKYCSESIPDTYVINDENWSDLISYLSEQYYKNEPDKHLVWILKPALLNNGQGIYLFQSIGDIESHYLNNNRFGGPHILQQYLTNPHLLQGPTYGHKYSLRMFVILSNYLGAFLYPHGYFNIALQPYIEHQYHDLSVHITNEHLSDEKANVVQIPTWQYELFKPFYPQIKTILTHLLEGVRIEYPQAFQANKKQKLAIFGIDFIVDANEKVWLIEANHGPCFPTSSTHPLQESLYEPFWKALVEEFVINNKHYNTMSLNSSFIPIF